jgi:hypothetical protein
MAWGTGWAKDRNLKNPTDPTGAYGMNGGPWAGRLDETVHPSAQDLIFTPVSANKIVATIRFGCTVEGTPIESFGTWTLINVEIDPEVSDDEAISNMLSLVSREFNGEKVGRLKVIQRMEDAPEAIEIYFFDPNADEGNGLWKNLNSAMTAVGKNRGGVLPDAWLHAEDDDT